MNQPAVSTQTELHAPSALLDAHGRLNQIGWARQPLLDCNLEHARFYALRFLQRFRIKRWDYYGVTTPTHFFSATLADLGYAGQAFVYLIELPNGHYEEATLTIPLGRGITLPRNPLRFASGRFADSTEGISAFDNGKVRLMFEPRLDARRISVRWPSFAGKDLTAELTLELAPSHESMTIVIPIAGNRFYYNRKVNCMPTEGHVEWGDTRLDVRPGQSLGNLDWGRGVWEYRSFWVWASASGFLPDGRTVGLNLGFGFGDTSAATENAVILNGRIHKLAQVNFAYDTHDFMRPWRMSSVDGRIDLEFVPSLERVAKTNLGLIASEVHQMFGQYRGSVRADDGEVIRIDGLTGFAEEHHARW